MALASLCICQASAAGAPDRIQGRIESSRYIALQGSVHPLARTEFELGMLDPDEPVRGVSLDLKPSPAQQTDLEKFLEEQRDPGSPEYQNWLTPEQFADRFGASAGDVAKIVSWLEAEGFTIDHIGAARTWILFSGTAGGIGKTFHASMRRYRVNGAVHYANATVPAVPQVLGGLVSSIRGLDDFRPAPMAHARRVEPQLNRGGYHYLGPDDVAAIYDVSALYATGADGTGQKLAIAGQTDISLPDIQEFRGLFNISANVPKVVTVGKDPGRSPDDEIEADLDIEWAGAVARNASIIYVNSNNVFTSLQYAIDQNLAPVVSVSYGACERGAPASFRTLAQQASAQGITWMNASGDEGAAGCDYGALVASNGPAVIFPADIPEVVAVGGTEFSETGNQGWSAMNGPTSASALGYIPEKAWNDTSPGNPIEASGGGASALFAKPWWQSGPGVPNDNARDVPDVALAASAQHDQYLVVTSDTLMSIGGTSAASPSFAGMVTLLNQYLVSKGKLSKPGLGSINPTLYALAPVASGAFHDITTGSNIVPCAPESKGCLNGFFGYNAGPGYDQVTGLGSVDAYKLASAWTSAPVGTGVTVSVSANPTAIAPSASTRLIAVVSAVSGKTAPTGTVAFMLNGTSIGSAALTATAPNAVSSAATLAVNGGALATGANTIVANYVPSGSFRVSSGSVTVTVAAPLAPVSMTVTAIPSTIATSGSTVLTAAVEAGGVPRAGSVKFTLGSRTLGTVVVSGSTATLSIKGASLAFGGNVISATYVPPSGLAGASVTATVTVTAASVPTALTVSASPPGITASGSTTITTVVKAVEGNIAPSGTVTLVRGGVILGSQKIASAAGASATVFIPVKGSSLLAGADTITATYTAAGNFASSAGSTVVTVAAQSSRAQARTE